MRIGILGIGGTGGFFGGKLARHYQDDKDVEIIFIARNDTRSEILRHGLKVESVEGDFIVRPDLVSDDTTEIGVLDVLLVCVKSYGLNKAVSQYTTNLKKGSVVITIQNLVDQAERVENILPEGVTLLEGCAYIISNIIAPGHVKHKGGPTTIYFGKDGDVEAFRRIEDVFVLAGVKATLSDAISKVIWKKFLLISPMAVSTSYFSCTLGELRSDPGKYSFFKGLMEELFQLVGVLGIGLGQEAKEQHLKALDGFPENGKTSLQLDIEKEQASEIDSLLDDVLAKAERYDLDLIYYRKASEKLHQIIK